MRQQIQAFMAEVHKNKHAKITWITFIAFSIAPIFGGLIMFLMKDGGYEGLSGILKSKAIMFSFSADWNSYLGLLSQAVGVGGVLIFGFVAAWLFGREFSDGTAKDLLSLPISRIKILNAKFMYYMIWCIALVLSNLFLGMVFGIILQIQGWHTEIFIDHMKIYFITTILIILLNTPIAFFAISGKGYLAPLGIVALALVMAQILGAIGFGTYFPWAVPGIFSGSGGTELKSKLNLMSYMILIFTSIMGYLGTIMWWKYADQRI